MKNQQSVTVSKISANPKVVKIVLAVLAVVGVVIPGIVALAGPVGGGI